MKQILLLAGCLLAASFTHASTSGSDTPLAVRVEQAVSTDPATAQDACRRLREAGPDGLQALEDRFSGQIAAHRHDSLPTGEWSRIRTALDTVGAQYDNDRSGLYWYTDLEKAKAAALASGRPILSLRLLGRLDEDLSCANSRLFRTTLYPSTEVNQLLKTQFVLYWESVRPAPRITVDFGDGRKLVRTITGNSIHYVLDANGTIIDALPGLYAAPVFAAELKNTADALRQAGGKVDPVAYRQTVQTRLLNTWAADLKTIGADFAVDQPLSSNLLENRTDGEKWNQIAALHTNPAGFDREVQDLIGRKFPTAETAAPLAFSKTAIETPLLRTMRNLSNTVAIDTVKNNYLLRTKILAFLADKSPQSWPVNRINNWVYDNIFLTPGNDPWLGLASPDVFSAIDGNGQIQVSMQP